MLTANIKYIYERKRISRLYSQYKVEVKFKLTFPFNKLNRWTIFLFSWCLKNLFSQIGFMKSNGSTAPRFSKK